MRFNALRDPKDGVVLEVVLDISRGGERDGEGCTRGEGAARGGEACDTGEGGRNAEEEGAECEGRKKHSEDVVWVLGWLGACRSELLRWDGHRQRKRADFIGEQGLGMT